MNTDLILNIPDYEGPGIYSFVGINNPYVYVGMSRNIKRRLKTHNSNLKSINSDCVRVSNRMMKYVKPGYLFNAEIVEKIDPTHSKKYLCEREITYIKKYKDIYGNNLLNDDSVGITNERYLDRQFDNLIRSLTRLKECYRCDVPKSKTEIQTIENTVTSQCKTLCRFLIPMEKYDKKYKHQEKYSDISFKNSVFTSF